MIVPGTPVLAGGVLYLVFQTLLLLTVGGSITILVTVFAAYVSKDQEYTRLSQLYGLAAFASSVGAILCMTILMAFDSFSEATVLTLPFLASVFGVALFPVLILLVLTGVFLYLFHRGAGRRGDRSSFTIAAVFAATSVLAVLFFNLVNTFMLIPPLPDGATLLVKADRLDPFAALSLMVNRGWIPLTLKMILVGVMTFAVLFSGTGALLRLRRNKGGLGGTEETMVSWGFKVGILFGAPLGILGYWNAAILHQSTPVLALGLMGQAVEGIGTSVISSLSPLWDIGIIGAMSLGGLAASYYLSKGSGYVVRQSDADTVLRGALPWTFALLILAVAVTLFVGQYYPGQYVLSLYVLVGGFLMFEGLRRYAVGLCRLYVPVIMFALACYGLIVYMAPYTKWYLAENFGGIPWPLIGFPLLVLAGYLAIGRWKAARYIVVLSAAFLAPLVILVKSTDAELVKGAGVVAIDPTVRDILDRWGFIHAYDLSAVYRQYASPDSLQVFFVLLLAYTAFVAIFYLAYRLTESYATRGGKVE